MILLKSIPKIEAAVSFSLTLFLQPDGTILHFWIYRDRQLQSKGHLLTNQRRSCVLAAPHHTKAFSLLLCPHPFCFFSYYFILGLSSSIKYSPAWILSLLSSMTFTLAHFTPFPATPIFYLTSCFLFSTCMVTHLTLFN